MSIIQPGTNGIGTAHLLAIDLLVQCQVLSMDESKFFRQVIRNIKCHHDRIFGILVEFFHT